MIIDQKKYSFKGEDYIDCSRVLHRLLEEEQISLKTRFSTVSSAYMSLFSVFYKESFIPDFSLDLHMGYPVIMIRGNKKESIILSSDKALNDGQEHEIILNFQNNNLEVFIDGTENMSYNNLKKWCNFGYVGFVNIGRSTSKNKFSNYFIGEISSLQVDTNIFDVKESRKIKGKEEQVLFFQGMNNVENYRIPSMVYADGVIIATADARMDSPGDNPNHISRAVRRSLDGGATWSDASIILDYGGEGRETGASAIDGSLLYDNVNKRVFMLYSHTKSGVGAFNSESAVGFDECGRMLLKDNNNVLYFVDSQGVVREKESQKSTEYEIDSMENLSIDGRIISNASVSNEVLEILPTTYLKIVYSDDCGETWSRPVDLNPMVKKQYMGFLGSGPGNGIQIKNGTKRGRLVYPIYYLNDKKKQINGIVYSDDYGENWHMTEIELKDNDLELTESQIVELKDGSLKIFCRNTSKSGNIITVVSNDCGSTFEDISYISIKNPYCQLSVLEFNDKYYLSTASDKEYRLNGFLYESTDTQNWYNSGQIEPGEFGYSSLAKADKEHICILYETKNQSLKFKTIKVN